MKRLLILAAALCASTAAAAQDVAITGGTISPGIFESVSALGREEVLARIDSALACE